MHDWLIELLRNPATGERLVYGNSKTELTDNTNGAIFPVVSGIPDFTGFRQPGQADLHKTFDTEFNYVDHYQKDAVVFDYFQEDESPAAKHELKRFRQSVVSRIPKDARLILDVGCGRAWIAGAMIPKGRQVVSLDVSLTNTEKALEAFPSPSHAAVMADVYNLPFPEQTFDCITACEIMEHLYDPQLFVTKLWSILKPGGTLIITTPYKEKTEYSLCVHCNKPTPRHAHLHSFDKSKMRNLTKTLIPSPSKVETIPVGNTLLIKLRTHILLNLVGLGIWKPIDTLFNRLFDKAFRVMLILKKE